MPLSREEIRDGALLRMLRDHGAPLMPVASEADLATSIAATLAAAPPEVRAGGDAWVFAYGSLIWNPAIHTVERRVATLRGWHRRLCLWTPLGRGCPANPGLVLGLERGGSCRGIAYRIAGPAVAEEFAVLWRREMISDGYLPRWVRLCTAEGPLTALAFVINRHGARYAGHLDAARTAATVASAHGMLGSNLDYVRETFDHLAALGIRDRHLAAVCHLIDPSKGKEPSCAPA